MPGTFYGQVAANSGGVFYGQVAAPGAVFYGQVAAPLSDAAAAFVFRTKDPDQPLDDVQANNIPRNTTAELTVVSAQAGYSLQIHRQPQNGAVTVVNNGADLALQYTPDQDWIGWGQIGYTILSNNEVLFSGSWLINVQDATANVSMLSIPNHYLSYNDLVEIDLTDYLLNPGNVTVDFVVTPIGGVIRDVVGDVITVLAGTDDTVDQITVRLIDPASNAIIQEQQFLVVVQQLRNPGFSPIPDQTLYGDFSTTLDLGNYVRLTGDQISWRAKDVSSGIDVSVTGNQVFISAPDDVDVTQDYEFTICLRDSNGNVMQQQVVNVFFGGNDQPTLYRVKIANALRTINEFTVDAKAGENIERGYSAPNQSINRSDLPLTISVTREEDGEPVEHGVTGSVTFKETVQ